MSQQVIKQAIESKKMRCPSCKGPVQKFEKFVEMAESVWDGAGDCDSRSSFAGSKVTLICGSCDWRERTEFWSNYIDE